MSAYRYNPNDWRQGFRFSLRSLLLIMLFSGIASYYYLGRNLRTENFEKIEVGMSEREVERLLGGASGDYGMNCRLFAYQSNEGSFRLPHQRQENWTNDRTRLEVFFNAHGKVAGKHRRGYHRLSLMEMAIYLFR